MYLVCDAHCDTFLWNYANSQNLILPELPKYRQVSGKLMRDGGVNLEIFSTFIHNTLMHDAQNLAQVIINDGKRFLEQEDITLVTSAMGLEDLNVDSTVGVLGLEGAAPLEDDPERLIDFYDLGVHVLTLVWSRKNAFSSGVGFDGGLSPKGEELINIAEDLGVVIDVSHLNSEGLKDMLDLSNNPFIASHSCADFISPHPRNLTDDQIEDISNAEGFIGITFCPEFLNGTKQASIQDVIDHIVHVSNIAGVESVGIGSDFDGTPIAPQGLDDVSDLSTIPPLLREAGFTADDVKSIMGRNLIKIFQEVWR